MIFRAAINMRGRARRAGLIHARPGHPKGRQGLLSAQKPLPRAFDLTAPGLDLWRLLVPTVGTCLTAPRRPIYEPLMGHSLCSPLD